MTKIMTKSGRSRVPPFPNHIPQALCAPCGEKSPRALEEERQPTLSGASWVQIQGGQRVQGP